MLKYLLLPFISFLFSFQPDVNEELDQYWAVLSQTVEEGDFDGYAALYHDDAVLVNSISGTSVPIATALEGWKEGFLETQAGRMKAGVEFRFSERLHGDSTAHETGIFRYHSQAEGAEPESAYIHFRALLVRSEGEWKMIMEHQFDVASQDEWDELE